MDTSEMRELLRGYLSELDWTGGATKDDLMSHLAGRDDALRTMVNQYVAEGTYRNLDEVFSVIPVQAWQDVQGDAWRGARSQYEADVPSHFQEGPVGQDTSDVYRAGGPRPQTPGFGQSTGASGGATGSGAGAGGVGDAGTNAGEVDPGVGGRGETVGETPMDTGGAGFGDIAATGNQPAS